MQINKSIGDAQTGLKFFENAAKVDEKMLKYREIVLKHQLPRRIELMDDLEVAEDKKQVNYLSFDANFEGLIASHVYHYQGNCDDVYELWKKDVKHFKKQ